MTKGISRHSLLLLLTSLLLLASCNSRTVYTSSVAMPGNTWGLMNFARFKVPVKDSASSNNIIFSIRTGSSYPFRNIYLFVTAVAPDGKSMVDTLQYNLADEKGNWYGKGFGDIRELDLPYKTGVYFPVRGTYQFKVQHGMRTEDLKGVYDFGLRIEKISK
jgi:gliding motility-associated lipoprotein GldH